MRSLACLCPPTPNRPFPVSPGTEVGMERMCKLDEALNANNDKN